jgi:hypothetical protein
LGQQQLLLIVLGTIVVGIAVVVGIDLFSASAVEMDRDSIFSVLTALSTDALAYYKKETQFGGGGGTFTGWKIPDSFKKHTNNKKYIQTNVKANKVTLNGYGTEIGRNGSATTRIRAIVTPTGIAYKIFN